MNLRRLSLLSALAFAALAGCGRAPEALIGRWEGDAGEGTLVLDLQPDGSASMEMRGMGAASDFSCQWSTSGERLKLTHENGQVASFRILSISGDKMDLRVGSGAGGVCHLRR